MSLDVSASELVAYQSYIATLTDEQVRVAVGAWTAAWNEVSDELAETLGQLTGSSVHQLRRSRQLAKSLEAIEEQLAALVAAADQRAVGALPGAVSAAGRANAAILAAQLPATYATLVTGFDQINPAALQSIINRTTQTIHAAHLPLADDAIAAMKTRLVRGLAAGDNPRVTARRMLKATETEFNGGMTRALRIARTETLDAMRHAQELSDEANRDVLTKWTWLATLSTRTCPACWTMHGREFDLDVPGPEGHQNCRCARVPVVKPWTELGIDIPEPPSNLPDPEATFAALSPAEQRGILGKQRYELWQQGRYPMDRWATKRSTEGWRDSWVVSPVSGGDQLPARAL